MFQQRPDAGRPLAGREPAARTFRLLRTLVRQCQGDHPPAPRPIPFKWFVSIWHKQKETLTFEADLDCAPAFHLDVFHHRWLSQRHSQLSSQPRDWSVSHPGPVILTTRTRWTQELSPVVNTLMTARGHNLISVRFRSESPHIAATVPLEALSDEQAAAGFLSVLRELAAGASASRQ